jgi:hypothetical protein
MDKLAYKIVKRAKELLQSGWVKNHSAVDRTGNYIDLTSKKAVAFCATGAVERATHELTHVKGVDIDWTAESNATEKVDAVLTKELPKSRKWGKDYVTFNDHPSTSHKDVIGLFTRAKRSLR